MRGRDIFKRIRWTQILNLLCLTKKYKYNQREHMPILKNVWGETIKKIGILMVLAIALLSVPALGQQSAVAGEGNVDVIGDAIFEAEGSVFRFDTFQDTSFDSVTVGNDKALAFGWYAKDYANAQNNLEIKKNQDSGDCECCSEIDQTTCSDCCYKVNLEQIKVGNREAMAFGFASATNNVKIVTNQQ
jgi:hypothetical protein